MVEVLYDFYASYYTNPIIIKISIFLAIAVTIFCGVILLRIGTICLYNLYLHRPSNITYFKFCFDNKIKYAKKISKDYDMLVKSFPGINFEKISKEEYLKHVKKR